MALGLQGYSYSKDESPKMCFNGPKSWQLGWYSDYHVDLSTNNYNWSGDLVGFAEKDNTNMMIIRIQDATKNTDTYVHFNHQIGFNSETKEGRNQVLVSTHSRGVGYGASTLCVKFKANGVYTINGIGGTADSMTITVNSIDTSNTPAKANVSIQLVPQSTQAPDVAPPTAAPIMVPTLAPVMSPTAAPVVAPTESPVAPPTVAPVVAPTKSLVTPPTAAPVVSLIVAPVAPLTDAQVVPPMHAPVVPPTDAPVLSPTAAPGMTPTAAPIVPLTDAPVLSPTAAPVAPPTDYRNCDDTAPSDECTDDASYTFQFKNKKQVKNCQWLSTRKNKNKQEEACDISGVVAYKCPQTCDPTWRIIHVGVLPSFTP